MKKRILSGAMAGVLALSLAVPAFATGTTAEPNTTNVDATYQAADIAVTVPETGKAFINPYGLDIEVPENAADSGNTNKTTISGQQIVSAPMAIKNESKMDLKVGATVTGTVKSGSTMTFAAASTKGTPDLPDTDANYVAPSTTKAAFVYLQAKASTAADTDLVGASTGVTADKIADAFAEWAPQAYNSTTDVVVGTREAKTEKLVSLRAATVTTSGSTTTTTYNPGSIALFRLSGDCPVSPRTAWAATDGFTTKIAFTFLVDPIVKYTLTKGTMVTAGASPTSIAGDVTFSVTNAAENDSVTITVANLQASEYATITLKDSAGATVAAGADATISGGNGSDVTATFKMPAKNLTVDIVLNGTANAFATPTP